ncbi:relaxase/mobilization nuclease domain-containing protein [Edaphocola aurantiacus]|uniref:relaxase/mobilization nuclease domain-containing protein n=1 Tax=Edaphocola aurantiacus TaxID=2601682 RepID=UPI001C96A93F|nr:relaxase/mobilization nuclease domain-containing protein [Edaphocola aurantiacus]
MLVYNERKVERAEASLLMAVGFGRDAGDLSFKSKLDRFQKLTGQNQRTQTNTLHISLNFSRQDVLDDELLCRLASDYMQAIGFGQQPYLVYRHYDAAHPHIHVATVNIAISGERIETHNIGKNQSEKARREIEDRYHLIRAEDQQKETDYMLRPAILEKKVYGKQETRAAITAIVREVTGTYRFTSLPELNAVLRQFNVIACDGQEGSLMRENGGLTFHLLDDQGQKVGVPIKASSIYGSPTLKNLEKKYGRNLEERKPYGLRLKHLLDRAIKQSGDRETLERNLREQGIRILLRENAQGGLQGVTFVDNATRSVFNGSSLGKEYGVKSFMERIEGMVNDNGNLATISIDSRKEDRDKAVFIFIKGQPGADKDKESRQVKSIKRKGMQPDK